MSGLSLGLPDLHIRDLAAEDLPAVLAIERASDLAPHWHVAEYRAAVENSASAFRRFCKIAEVNSEITGFVVVKVIPAAKEAEIESIVVGERHRRAGVGRALLKEALTEAKLQGARDVVLEVRGSNGPAIALYERFGFGRTGLRPRYYSGPDEDAVLMRLTL